MNREVTYVPLTHLQDTSKEHLSPELFPPGRVLTLAEPPSAAPHAGAGGGAVRQGVQREDGSRAGRGVGGPIAGEGHAGQEGNHRTRTAFPNTRDHARIW